jgi:hypothetical protein
MYRFLDISMENLVISCQESTKLHLKISLFALHLFHLLLSPFLRLALPFLPHLPPPLLLSHLNIRPYLYILLLLLSPIPFQPLNIHATPATAADPTAATTAFAVVSHGHASCSPPSLPHSHAV